MTATHESLPEFAEKEVPSGVQLACSHCHDQLLRREVAFCATCLAPHHTDCFEQHRRCAAPGCAGKEIVFPSARAEPVPREPRWVIYLATAIAVGASAVAVLGVNSKLVAEEATRADLAAKTAELDNGTQGPKDSDATKRLKGAALVRRQAAPAKPSTQGPASRTPLALTSDPGPLKLEPGKYTTTDIVERWATLVNRDVRVSPPVATLTFEIKTARTLDRNELRVLLGTQDVVLFVGPGRTAQAVQRRNLYARVGSPVLVNGPGSADPDQYVSRLIQVRHGSGNTIFATLRGIMTRDVSRLGNILWSGATNTVTIIDLAYNVRRYEELLHQYDQPSVRAQAQVRVEVFRVSNATWTELKDEPRPSAIKALRDLSGEVLLETVDLDVDPQASGATSRLFKRTVGKTTVELSSDTTTSGTLALSLKASTNDHAAELTARLSLRSKRYAGLTAKSLPSGEQLILVVTTP